MLSSLLMAVFAVQASEEGFSKLQIFMQQLIDWGVGAGGRIIGAAIIFVVGRFLISFIKKLVSKLLVKRNIDASIQSFVKSLVNILLTILLIIAVIGKLGVETTSFAALLASAGTVREIQIFHTILTTSDNKVIYIPNGALSSGTVTNYSREDTRRVEWIIGVEYGENYDKVESTVRRVLAADSRVLDTPEPFVALHALDASSVNVVIRVWVKSSDYWGVYFDMNKNIYTVFNEEGIGFPFPQLTVHQAKD